jgi:hypothetical protein
MYRQIHTHTCALGTGFKLIFIIFVLGDRFKGLHYFLFVIGRLSIVIIFWRNKGTLSTSTLFYFVLLH